ncbi:hypothetical protein [Streptomyces sp. NRRL F-5123]|uniref:hypothetical protein n=1 Tax=Streptomyces sp. NRRL F-5123 TaxID=1463856 RepID=UPI0004E1B1B2|nr:hypothetical protein [Streptomyces sp. NRRL F-5123]
MGERDPGPLERWLRGEDRRPRGISPAGPKPWVRTRPPDTCPVPERQRVWTERWLRWCEGQFGPAVPHREVAVPGFAPAGFTGTQEEAEELLRRVGAVMGADVSGIRVLLVESPEREQHRRHKVGQYRKVLGRAVIELDTRVADRPDSFTGLVAHELAHARLAGEGRVAGLRLSSAEEERLTDLATVHLGMGVLTARAAEDYDRSVDFSVTAVGDLTDHMLTGRRDELHQMGYLEPAEFGYALACWAVARGEPGVPPWARHLPGGVRDALRQGLAYRAVRGD